MRMFVMLFVLKRLKEGIRNKKKAYERWACLVGRIFTMCEEVDRGGEGYTISSEIWIVFLRSFCNGHVVWIGLAGFC